MKLFWVMVVVKYDKITNGHKGLLKPMGITCKSIEEVDEIVLKFLIQKQKIERGCDIDISKREINEKEFTEAIKNNLNQNPREEGIWFSNKTIFYKK